MKEIKFERKDILPYSLHDMRITNIKYDDNDLTFEFKDGIEKDNKKVKASVKITKVDFDFSTITLMSDNGYYGEFNGEKMELTEFVDNNKDFKIEIVDELHGYNMVQYNGFLDIKDRKDLIECSIYVYYSGDYLYLID